MKIFAQTTLMILTFTIISFGQEQNHLNNNTAVVEFNDSIFNLDYENVIVLTHKSNLQRVVFRNGSKTKICLTNDDIIKGNIDSIGMNGIHLKDNFIEFGMMKMISFKNQDKSGKGSVLVTIGGITTLVGVIVLTKGISKSNNADDIVEVVESTGPVTLGFLVTALGVGLLVPGIAFLSSSDKFDLLYEWKISTESMLVKPNKSQLK